MPFCSFEACPAALSFSYSVPELCRACPSSSVSGLDAPGIDEAWADALLQPEAPPGAAGPLAMPGETSATSAVTVLCVHVYLHAGQLV